MPSTASAANCVVNVLVAGTARSVPARVINATSAASDSGEPPRLVIAMVRAPQSRAHISVLTISSVCPACDRPGRPTSARGREGVWRSAPTPPDPDSSGHHRRYLFHDPGNFCKSYPDHETDRLRTTHHEGPRRETGPGGPVASAPQ